MALHYFNFYVSDFLGGTAHFSPAEKGILIHLLCLCWQTPTGTIPKDEEWIFRHLRPKNKKEKDIIRSVLKEKFKTNRGRLYNKRLREERKKSKKMYDNKRDQNRKRKKQPEKAPQSNTLKDKENNFRDQFQPKPEPEPNEDKSSSSSDDDKKSFDQFWIEYPATQGQNKEASRKLWIKLGADDKAKAFNCLSLYKKQLKQSNSVATYPFIFLRDKIFDTFSASSEKTLFVAYKGTPQWKAWKIHKIKSGIKYIPDTITSPTEWPTELNIPDAV